VVTTPLTEVSFLAPLEQPLQRVRAALRDFSNELHESLRPLAEHGALDRGKLLRPALLLLSGGIHGALGESHIQAAVIVELIHNATLVHDDVLDHGWLRRGVPTVNRRWNDRVAVRFGDLLLSHVLRLTARLPPAPRAIFSRVVDQTCAGEIRQTVRAGDFTLTEPEYLALIGQKTAALFEGACSLGACLANAATGACRALERFGHHAGMAYQIMDDLLDVAGESQARHKTVGTDLQSAKLTLPLIHALRVRAEPEKASLLLALQTRSLTRPELLRRLAAGGSLDYVLARIEAHARRAGEALQDVAPGPLRAALLEVPKAIVREAVEGVAEGLRPTGTRHRVSPARR
jgi:octaprenyl-diphosphate synthase